MVLAMSPTEMPSVSAAGGNLADKVVMQLASIKVVRGGHAGATPAKACRARACVH